MTNEAMREAVGSPIHFVTQNAIISVTDVPQKQKISDPKLDSTSKVGEYTVAPWGDNNDYPIIAENIINKSTVLGAGLRFKNSVILSQGVYVYKITGYSANGEPIKEVTNKPETIRFLSTRMVRTYLECAGRDVLKFGNAFPHLVPDKGGKKIVHIYAKNAKYCRYEKMTDGIIKNVIFCGSLPDSGSEVVAITCLNPDNPEYDMQVRAEEGKLTKEFIYPVKDNFSNNAYYGLPEWETARQSGWISIAEKIPAFLSKMYENQISPKYHIQVPYKYFERKFPRSKFKNDEEWKATIATEIDSFEKNMTSTDNAKKTIITFFELNEKGEAEEKISITPIDEKWSNENLMTSAVSNSEILFSLMINPSMLGAGLPGGGPYSNSGGGSNIRESFLINVAIAWNGQQRILDPLEAMMRFNGMIGDDEQLGFQKTILTTLDSGSGTAKVLS